ILNNEKLHPPQPLTGRVIRGIARKNAGFSVLQLPTKEEVITSFDYYNSIHKLQATSHQQNCLIKSKFKQNL
ncbi:MAG: hypothetical protein WA865_06640, partial [Spirulinaceae cyanobacterium]